MENTQWSTLITNAQTFGVDTISPVVLSQIKAELERKDLEKRREISKKREERMIIQASRDTRDAEQQRRIDMERKMVEAERYELKAKRLTEWREKLKEYDKQKALEKKELISLARKGLEKRSCPFPFPTITRPKPVKLEAPVVSLPQSVPGVSTTRSFRRPLPRPPLLKEYNKSVRLAAAVYSTAH